MKLIGWENSQQNMFIKMTKVQQIISRIRKKTTKKSVNKGAAEQKQDAKLHTSRKVILRRLIISLTGD